MLLSRRKNKNRRNSPIGKEEEFYWLGYVVEKTSIQKTETTPLLFTWNEIKVAKNRARNQPEDAPAYRKKWWKFW